MSVHASKKTISDIHLRWVKMNSVLTSPVRPAKLVKHLGTPNGLCWKLSTGHDWTCTWRKFSPNHSENHNLLINWHERRCPTCEMIHLGWCFAFKSSGPAPIYKPTTTYCHLNVFPLFALTASLQSFFVLPQLPYGLPWVCLHPWHPRALHLTQHPVPSIWVNERKNL